MSWLKWLPGLLVVILAGQIAGAATPPPETAHKAEAVDTKAAPHTPPEAHAAPVKRQDSPAPPKPSAAPKDEIAALNASEVKTVWDSLTNDFTKTSRPVETRPKPNVPGNNPSDPALRNSSASIANTNVLAGSRDPETGAASERFRERLETALQLRDNRDFERAARELVTILLADAPEEIHRTALLELALLAQQENQPLKAQQIFSQYVRRFAEDASVPEVLLRQGLLYRQMGAHSLALVKFYAVMTQALNFKSDHLDYYQRMVLLAQTEIADTYYLQGKYEEATDFFKRLLKLDARELNKSQIQYKLIRGLAYLNRETEVISQAQDFLGRYPGAAEAPEARFLLATSLKKLGRTRDALQQVMQLLESQQSRAAKNPENWFYWQQRTGNEIANQLFKEGDYANALEVYLNLAQINPSAAWQVPVQYQIGLVFERLGSPPKASESYQRVLAHEGEVATNGTPSLKAIMEMAKWRKDYLKWETNADQARREFLVTPPATKAETP